MCTLKSQIWLLRFFKAQSMRLYLFPDFRIPESHYYTRWHHQGISVNTELLRTDSQFSMIFNSLWFFINVWYLWFSEMYYAVYLNCVVRVVICLSCFWNIPQINVFHRQRTSLFNYISILIKTESRKCVVIIQV